VFAPPSCGIEQLFSALACETSGGAGDERIVRSKHVNRVAAVEIKINLQIHAGRIGDHMRACAWRPYKRLYLVKHVAVGGNIARAAGQCHFRFGRAHYRADFFGGKADVPYALRHVVKFVVGVPYRGFYAGVTCYAVGTAAPPLIGVKHCAELVHAVRKLLKACGVKVGRLCEPVGKFGDGHRRDGASRRDARAAVSDVGPGHDAAGPGDDGAAADFGDCGAKRYSRTAKAWVRVGDSFVVFMKSGARRGGGRRRSAPVCRRA